MSFVPGSERVLVFDWEKLKKEFVRRRQLQERLFSKNELGITVGLPDIPDFPGSFCFSKSCLSKIVQFVLF
jgi:hypothetical protein